jgi:hypothetical protein
MKVFIYTFGKVASSTLGNSISKYLDSDGQESTKINIYPPFSSVEPNVIQTHDHYVVRQYLQTGAKCKIISVYRELIAHTISAFFQNICNTNNWRCNYLFYVGNENYVKSLPMDKIIEIFLHRVIEYHPQHWFNILNRVLDINIFHLGFNKNEGYQIYSGKNFELLIFRYDKLNQVTDVIKNFLDLSSFELHNSNLSTDKWYADLYSEFSDVFRPPDWMITRYLNSNVSHYFMQTKSIQELINYYRRSSNTQQECGIISVGENGFWKTRHQPKNSLNKAAKLFNEINGKIIVEIGSGIQGEMSGNSAIVWSTKTEATKIIVIDLEEKHINEVKVALAKSTNLIPIVGDGINFLKNYDGEKIDLLYLDFWVKDPPNTTLGTGRANAYLEAYLSAKDNMSIPSMILIDDTDHVHPWKHTFIVPQASKDGFKVIWEGRQTLLMKC